MRSPSRRVDRAVVTPAMEDCLKAIRHARRDAHLVSTKRLAAALGVSGPSVTNMVKRLDSLGPLRHSRHRGVVLTVDGERIAIAVEQRNAIISRYLVEVVGVPGDIVDAEAEPLEHHMLETRLAEALQPKPSP